MESSPADAGTPNPSIPRNDPEAASVKRKRIPMSIPTRKLEVPEIPGYHQYWFKESNVARAIQGGYEFVDADATHVNSRSVGTDREIGGNADLGSRVRVVAGEDERRDTVYLVLMKIKLEWYNEDQKIIERRNADILSGIFRDEQIMEEDKHLPQDRPLNYVDRDRTRAVYNRPTRKGKS